jgi:hypothetical protein
MFSFSSGGMFGSTPFANGPRRAPRYRRVLDGSREIGEKEARFFIPFREVISMGVSWVETTQNSLYNTRKGRLDRKPWKMTPPLRFVNG